MKTIASVLLLIVTGAANADMTCSAYLKQEGRETVRVNSVRVKFPNNTTQTLADNGEYHIGLNSLSTGEMVVALYHEGIALSQAWASKTPTRFDSIIT